MLVSLAFNAFLSARKTLLVLYVSALEANMAIRKTFPVVGPKPDEISML